MLPLHRPDLLRPQAYFAGTWQDGTADYTLTIRNPATHETLATLQGCSIEQVRSAMATAAAAQPAWRALTAEARAATLLRWHGLMLQHQEDLARLLTAEQGKPLAEARAEIAYAASFLQWFAEEGKRVYGEVIPSPFPHSRLLVLKEPVGVCAAITPWNFPAAMITRKAGAALAAGCAMLVKPAEQTPLSALALAVLAEQAGVPAGIFSVVVGEPVTIGAELTANPTVRKLSFTGSTEVGKLLMAQCAPTLKKLTLELGGNAPFIVFDDADLEAAVAGAVTSKYRNSGQTCICANRFLVQNSIYAAFAARLADAVGAFKVGNGMDTEVQQGPLIDEAALCKVEGLVADAVAQGATVLGGGTRHPLGGTFYTPTVLTDVTPTMRVAQEEIFGPIAPLFRFHSEAEAIQLANATPYGLAAYLYTRDSGRVWRMAEALEYGIVGINSGVVSTPVAPFGGMKQSGLGREGGRYGIEEYLEIKYVHWGGV